MALAEAMVPVRPVRPARTVPLRVKELAAALLFVVCFATSNAIVAAQDYDVSDIRCTFATSAGSRDSISAKLRKPDGFKGSPLFADDRAVDPVSDKECQIKPDPGDAAKLMYTLLVTDFSRCGVLKRNGFVHVRVWFPQFPGVVMMSDQELIIMCKPPEPTIIENKAAGFAGSFPHGARVSGVVEETPGRLEYEVALYKEAPTRVGAQGQLALPGELPVDQAVPIGTKLQLRARINPDSAWKFLKLMEVTVSPDPDDAHMLGSVALVTDGCRNRDFASIIPHQPARYRDRHNEVFLDFEAFLLSTMRERSTLWIHSQIKACMDAADCQPDYCLDLFEPAGHGRRRRQVDDVGFNALNGSTVMLGHRGGRLGPPSAAAPPGTYRQARGRGVGVAADMTATPPPPQAQPLTQRFHHNGTGPNSVLQQFAKFDENIEYSVLMPGEMYGRGASAVLESSCGTFLLVAAVLGCLLLCAACLMCYLAARLHAALGTQLHAKSLDVLVREHSRRFHHHHHSSASTSGSEASGYTGRSTVH
ncbi:uncharacterized protein LOC117650935 [Thrips palmi]|uniref:Uncharacterized protein LOC117650935 n=1 Tax=Thrips palmi TaxID=161013 RepID=A0A6P8ZYJ3_THRPL|nr:uncharacterized protein LOC117650935 [Thrips palmi]